jgi:hypothetical protein
MPMATVDDSTFAPPEICELNLRLRLRRVGMRLERNGNRYKLLCGDTVLLAKGPDGFGLSLEQIDRFTRRFAR